MEIKTILLPQDQDTYVQEIVAKPFSCRYASMRSSDSKESGQNGQDYVSFMIADKKLAFSVCDGVSQSFYGDLASKYLGERLLSWLCDKMPLTLDEEALYRQLSEYLTDLSRLAVNEIKNHQVPEDVSELLAEVLEEKRVKGSETTFVSSLVELPNRLSKEGRVFFSWMGNCRLRLGTEKVWGEMVANDPDSDKGKWSTKKGITSGELHLKTFALMDNKKRAFDRILVYTDGLALLDEIDKKPDTSQLNRLISQAVGSNYSDDCSFLEVELKR
jgi:hypothetical protein